MDRIAVPARPGWHERVRADGLVYVDTALPDGTVRSYWNETAAYRFTADDIARIEEAAAELHALHVAAADHVVRTGGFARFGIPDWCVPAVVSSWEAGDPSVYGRFDLAYDGSAVKLLEFNADTPTSLPEAAFVQLRWLTEVFPDAAVDQWNVVDDALVAQWRALAGELASARVHMGFIIEPTGEDLLNVSYQATAAARAGLDPVLVPFDRLAFDGRGRARTPEGEAVETLFKLYPWEWLAERDDAPALFAGAAARPAALRWIEPAYKLLWSNKAMLALLWELFPDHPNLVPAYEHGPRHLADYVRKPILGREGANVTIVRDGEVTAARPGPYGAEGFVFQQYVELPTWPTPAGPATPCLGVWMVAGIPAGLGIRESYGPITDDLSCFTPHIVAPSG